MIVKNKMVKNNTKKEKQIMYSALEILWNRIYQHNELFPSKKNQKEMEIIDKLINDLRK